MKPILSLFILAIGLSAYAATENTKVSEEATPKPKKVRILPSKKQRCIDGMGLITRLVGR